MQRVKTVTETKHMFRHAQSSAFEYKQVQTMIALFKSEMAREWDDDEKVIYWSSGNSKTHIPSYSTMPGLDCVGDNGAFPPCFVSGECYALRDIIYTGCMANAVHNSVLIRKYPEAFRKSLLDYVVGSESENERRKAA